MLQVKRKLETILNFRLKNREDLSKSRKEREREGRKLVINPRRVFFSGEHKEAAAFDIANKRENSLWLELYVHNWKVSTLNLMATM